MLLSPVAKATRDVICDVINIINAVSKAKALNISAAYNLYRLFQHLHCLELPNCVQMVISVLGCPFFCFYHQLGRFQYAKTLVFAQGGAFSNFVV